MKTKKCRYNYKKVPVTKMSKMMKMYLEAVRNELLEGHKVGYPDCYVQIVEKENYVMNLALQSFLKRRKRNLSHYKLGPLNKKVFINLYHKHDKDLMVARSLPGFGKAIYKKVMEGKKFQKYVD